MSTCLSLRNKEHWRRKWFVDSLAWLFYCKKVKMILPTPSKKPHNFVRKTKNYLQKTPNDLERLHPDFSEEGEKERQVDMWVFSAKI